MAAVVARKLPPDKFEIRRRMLMIMRMIMMMRLDSFLSHSLLFLFLFHLTFCTEQ